MATDSRSYSYAIIEGMVASNFLKIALIVVAIGAEGFANTADTPQICPREYSALVDSILPNVPKGTKIERIGQHFRLTGSELKSTNSLSAAIVRNPKYFRKFEIEFRDDGTLILPTTKRLRTLIDRLRKAKDPSAPNVNFEPTLNDQVESPFDYLAKISTRRRPFFPISLQGSSWETDSLFLHDWTAHWLGMATLPENLVREIRGTSALFREILSNKALGQNRKFRKKLEYYWTNKIVESIDLGTGLVATGLKMDQNSALLNGVSEIRKAGISEVTKHYHSGDSNINELIRGLSTAEKAELDSLILKYQDPKYAAPLGDPSHDVEQIQKAFNE